MYKFENFLVKEWMVEEGLVGLGSWWGLVVVLKDGDLGGFLFVGSMGDLWSVAAKVRLEVV